MPGLAPPLTTAVAAREELSRAWRGEEGAWGRRVRHDGLVERGSLWISQVGAKAPAVTAGAGANVAQPSVLRAASDGPRWPRIAGGVPGTYASVLISPRLAGPLLVQRLAPAHSGPAADRMLRKNKKAHALGEREGQYSIRINDQWRICFAWRDGDVYEVEIVDYH